MLIKPNQNGVAGLSNGYSVSVDQVNEREWNEIVPLFADASPYQTWAYGAVRWGEHRLSHLIVRRHQEVVAAAQVRLIQMPIIGKGVAYLRWGPLWQRRAESPERQHLHEAVKALVREYSGRRGLSLRIVPRVFREDPYAADFEQASRSCQLHTAESSRSYHTILLDIAEPMDSLRKQLHQKWRNQLNAAERNGLKVTEGTQNELFDRFLDIYDEMRARKGFETAAPPCEFARVQQRLPEGCKMIVMLAEQGDKVLSGLVAWQTGKTGIYLHGATSNSGMQSKGSYLLQWQMIRRLKENGCQVYDLGGINPELNPGVYRFKKGLGGESVQQLPQVEAHGDFASKMCVAVADLAKPMMKARAA